MFAFSIERDILLKPLLTAAGVAEKKHNLAILANILLTVDENYLYLNATDTEIEIAATIPLTFPPLSGGATTVPAKKLIDICRSVTENSVIMFKQTDNKVLINVGKSKFSLATLPSDDFPKISNDIKSCEFNFPTATLKALLNATSFSMAQQDVRYYLNGVLLEYKAGKLAAVATDGHRLALCEFKSEQEIQPFRVILPRKGVLELLKILDQIDEETIDASLSNNHFYFETNLYTFVSKLINGSFPNYNTVLPASSDKEVILDRGTLKKALARVAILSNEKYRGVKLDITPCLLKIIANNPEQEQAEEELDANTLGDSLTIGFNVSYMLDVLNVLPEGEVKLSFSTPDSSVLIESQVFPNSKYVIMPMKI